TCSLNCGGTGARDRPVIVTVGGKMRVPSQLGGHVSSGYLGHLVVAPLLRAEFGCIARPHVGRLSTCNVRRHIMWMQFKRNPPLPCRPQYFPVGLRQQQLKWGSKGRDGLLPHSCHQGAWTSGSYP